MCSEYKNRRRDDDEPRDKRFAKLAGGKRTDFRSGIGGIDGRIGQPVEGHSRRARRHQRDNDPDRSVQVGDAARGQHGAGQTEGERKDGVLPLDHFQGGPDAAKEGHSVILTGRLRFRLGLDFPKNLRLVGLRASRNAQQELSMFGERRRSGQ